MRYTEIINELNMSPGHLAKFGQIKGGEILGGFEAEMILNDVLTLEDAPDWDYDKKFDQRDDFDDIADFFEVSRSGRRHELSDAEKEYYDWEQDTINEYVEDRLEELMAEMSREHNEKYDKDSEPIDFDNEARDILINKAEAEEDTSIKAWLDNLGIREYSEFAEHFGLNWPYRIAPDEGEYDMDVAEDSADDIRRMLGKTVKVNHSYHGGRQENTYHIEPDSSLTADDPNDMGIELVSPPMPLPEMMSDLEKVMKYIDIHAYTNSTTGLHINLSIPNASEIDYVKLVLFLGDSYVLEQFDRLSNTYARSAFEIVDRARYDDGKGEKAFDLLQQGLVQAASKALKERNKDKYTSVNMHSNYVEFRSMGGDYVTKWDEIKTAVMRFAQALHIACDPEAEKKAYALKMYKLLAPQDHSINDVVRAFSMYRSGAIKKPWLLQFLKARAEKRKADKEIF